MPVRDGGAASCPAGGVRCNSNGRRETCLADGGWSETDFVCTINVAVDDEIGSICATKADGRYRCWNSDGTASSAGPLPLAKYKRVQLATQGPVGLTDDGRVYSVGIQIPADLPPVAKFRATNMWGSQGLCFLSNAGTFLYGDYRGPDPAASAWHVQEGPFADATCAFEGFSCAITPAGTSWGYCSPRLPGSDWVQVALGLTLFCGLTTNGNVRCNQGLFIQNGTLNFPPGPYRQVAVTYKVACALRENGELVCLRADGRSMPVGPDHFTFVDAGADLVCAIRGNGTSVCFRHDGAFDFTDISGVTGFSVPAPTLDPDW